MGHEFIGVVEDVGADVRTVKSGDLVVAPFAVLRRHLRLLPGRPAHLLPARRVRYGFDSVDGGQGEAVRVPHADGTLVVAAVGPGPRADAVAADAHRRDGDRPPCRASRRRSAPGKTVGRRRRRRRRPVRRHRRAHGSAPSRSSSSAATPIASRWRSEFGATDVVSERGEEAVERVRELTGGFGAHSVLECVGLEQSTADRARASRVPAASSAASASAGRRRFPTRCRRSSATSPSAAASPPPAPTSRSCCRTSSRAGSSPAASSIAWPTLDEVPDGYRAMNDREAIKVMVRVLMAVWTSDED